MAERELNQTSRSKSFYEIMWLDDNSCGIAYAPPRFPLLYLHRNEALLPEWNMPTFYLREGPFADYQPSDVVTQLCSEKMRDIIEAHRHSTDVIEWLPVDVTDAPPPVPVPAGIQLPFPEMPELKGVGENQHEEKADEDKQWQTRRYYVLHLLEELDVANWPLSLVDPPGHIIKPHLSLAKVGDHEIFRYKGGGDNVCLSNRLRLALLEWGCTGCHFWRIPAS